ncbi:response regulator [Spirosoma sp. HMF4905]|uniref:Response regulator n=1 Tax=Spirosoma arboris TaxID=2682092 RepID=A0A7K1SQV5_9BACT|nr:response regulator [Spirosoma arboris]MVM36195.1 response regulator [Spirosoma arboris]
MKNAHDLINANFKNAKLLIVEDNNDQWLIIQQAMRQCMSELTAERVSTLEQAMTLLNDWRYQEWEIPKLILLDLYLPTNADGWWLLKQIRAMSSSIGKLPIVMLTSSVDPIDIKDAYRLGVSAYVVKPIEFADWLTCFRELRTYWLETVTLPSIQYEF